jgi:protein-S-isoprenylcysteine O-methyltransferase Ste14
MSDSLRPPSVAGAVLAVAGGLVFVAALAVGVVAYVYWFGVSAGPWSMADGVPAIAIDILLFTGFALHHSVFARTGAKRWVGAAVSPALERTVYVWIASGLFLLLCWMWQPVPGMLWAVDAPWALAFGAVQFVGVGLSLHGARQLDVWDLAGIRQAFGGTRPQPAGLIRGGLYRLVRHPIYLGWILMVWPTPTMTGTRLVFAAASTAYLIAAIPFEERTLRREFGADYDAYARAIRWRILPFVY